MDFKDSLFSRISSIFTKENTDFKEVYLVGGSIRDYLLGKENFDLDFVMPNHAIKAAKLIADAFNGDFYVLDGERGTARAIIETDSKKKYIDFAKFNGQSIFEDLENRDFTINSLAIDISKPDKIIDLLSGKKHLEQKLLYPCSKKSFINDPVRILRAIRFLGTLDLRISESVFDSIREASILLPKVSNERIRDELFRILSDTNVAESLHRLVSFDVFDKIFPELFWLQEEQIENSNIAETFKPKFETVSYVSRIINQFSKEPNTISDEVFFLSETEFKNIKPHLLEYFYNPIHPTRGIKELIIVSALFHNPGRKNDESIIKTEADKHPEKTEQNAKCARKWGMRMALSKAEIDFISRVVDNRYKGVERIDPERADSREEIYKFYKATGKTGATQCFIHLANMLATYEGTVPPKVWKQELKSVRLLLEAWFLHKGEFIDPPRIISGIELINVLKIERGPRVGELLEKIRVAQVKGKIDTKQQALEYCRELIKA